MFEHANTGSTAPNDTKENDITLLLEIVDQFCKKIQRALKKRFFTVQFRVYEEELLSAQIVLKNYSFFQCFKGKSRIFNGFEHKISGSH